MLVFSVGLALLLLTASAASAAPDSKADSKANTQGSAPGRVLVKFKDLTPQSTIDEQVKGNSARVLERINALDVLVLNVPQAQEQKVINALSRNPNVEYAEPDYLGFGTSVSNDPNFGTYQ